MSDNNGRPLTRREIREREAARAAAEGGGHEATQKSRQQKAKDFHVSTV
jgi:hypothetical protein